MRKQDYAQGARVFFRTFSHSGTGRICGWRTNGITEQYLVAPDNTGELIYVAPEQIEPWEPIADNVVPMAVYRRHQVIAAGL